MEVGTNNNYWYLWDTHFDEDETMVIEISYSLPHGIVKGDLYYMFDYLLNTGSGWKGTIDTAEIIVNLKNFDRKLILKTSPENFTASGNQLIWKLYNIEPTIKDDISIKYEKGPGQYAERLRNSPSALVILDEKTILSNDLRNPNYLDALNPADIVYIRVIKNFEEAKLKFPNIDSSNGLLLIYSNKFIPERLIGILNSKLAGNHKEKIKLIPLSEFMDMYSLDINGQIITKERIPDEIMRIDEFRITEVLIKDLKKNKCQISIRTNK